MNKGASVIAGPKWQRAWRAFIALQSQNMGTQIDWVEGLRAAFGIALPAAIGLLENHLVWGILCSFATLWVLMCDVGGAYRQKAINLVASGVVILCAYIFGGWMILSVPNYILGMFLWVSGAALIGIAGNAAAQAGMVSSTIVITSVVLFVPSEFWVRLLLCATGFGWALLLSLALWPLAPYTPILQALSASFTRLADLGASFWSGAAAPGRSADNLPFAIAYDGVMTSLERSRGIWGAFRARRAGPTVRSLGLLALIEQLDDVARTLVTLREELNLLAQEKWFGEFRHEFTELTDSLSKLSREIAEAVAVAGHNVDPAHLQHAFQRLESAITAKSPREALLQRKEIFRTTKHLVEQASAVAETASELSSGNQGFREPPEAQYGPRPQTFDPVVEIRNNMSFRSSSFRHALRLGATSALAGLIASGEHLVRGYWIPMTVVIVLKPNFGGTLQRSVQRITGTILGALLGALLVLVSSEPWVLWAVLPVLVFATFALRNFNYTLFSLALTPTVLLMLDIAHPITVADSFLRVLHTIVGSALALLSGYLLFPQWESSRLPLRIAEALRAEAAFVRALRDAVLGKNERPLSEFRRDAAVAVSNAFTAGQRLLSEPPDRRGDVESSLAAVNFCRRILHVLAAISDYQTRESAQPDSKQLAGFLQALAQALDDLANSLVDGVDPKRLSDLPILLDQLEEIFMGTAKAQNPSAAATMDDSAIAGSLFYHLKNAVDLTLAIREAISRLAVKYTNQKRV
ncbi:MAG: FUSC family protein [Verrucomicrobia bacterium]|nr:FUSC family protein [Verrucomicrobiota bacterium]